MDLLPSGWTYAKPANPYPFYYEPPSLNADQSHEYSLNNYLSANDTVLVSCPTNSFTYTFDLVEDLLACGGPDEGSRFRVVGFDEDLDLGDEVLRTDKGSAPDLALGYQSEPAFDLIEP